MKNRLKRSTFDVYMFINEEIVTKLSWFFKYDVTNNFFDIPFYDSVSIFMNSGWAEQLQCSVVKFSYFDCLLVSIS